MPSELTVSSSSFINSHIPVDVDHRSWDAEVEPSTEVATLPFGESVTN